MFKLNYILMSSAGKVCRQFAASLNAKGTHIGSGLQRTLCSSPGQPQETPNSSSASEKSSGYFSIFPPMPGMDSPLRWDGMKFEELPIVHIKATFNNTIIQVINGSGKPIALVSCGTEGFKNRKKSTPVASQATGLAAAQKALEKGVVHARVVLNGVGPGRLPAVKGLNMGGLRMVSITDNTPLPHNGCRPRKAKRY
ncbi:small ribosomal subunit protein uS11m [Aulostomus maculatus]